MSLSKADQAFFDAIDEMPMRRSGGFIVSIDGSKPGKGAEFRSRAGKARAARFPRLERRRSELAILTHMLEREERQQ